MAIIERIARAQGASNIRAASDGLKLEVYKLTLEEIFRALGQDLQEFPVEYLEDLESGMRAIIDGFYYLSDTPIIKYVDIEQAMMKINSANAYLLSAITAIKGGKTRDYEHYMALQACRSEIFRALRYLPKDL